MDDVTRLALEGLAKAVAMQPPPGPVVVSDEHLRLIERLEARPESRPGTDKSWTERVLVSWKRALESAVELPPK